ncbi:MAG: transglutaminase family protein [Clostridium sp.]|nr:transglutaminase family protein [Clostridium sp.]
MKNLKFHYRMRLSFDVPIREHRFTLKCIPLDSDRQEIYDLEVDVYPNEFISKDFDSFGNFCYYGYAKNEHNKFYIDVMGKARTGLADCESESQIHKIGFYKYQTEYTKPGQEMNMFYNSISFSEDAGNLDKALLFMNKLYNSFSYVQGVTGIETTAEEALRLGQGVCQDYAHIMLGLCRMEHIPCRYVVGMLMGEGLSHAWVDIYENGRWIALDPTNNLIVKEDHIKISNGRDYKDCNINQGVFYGNAKQLQDISVLVEEL